MFPKVWIAGTKWGLRRIIVAHILIVLILLFLFWIRSYLLVTMIIIWFLTKSRELWLIAKSSGLWLLLEDFSVADADYHVRDYYSFNGKKFINTHRAIVSKDDKFVIVRKETRNAKHWSYFDFLKKYLINLGQKKPRFLLLGGGSSLSDNLLKMFPKATIDIVELSKKMIRISKKYFIDHLNSDSDASNNIKIHNTAASKFLDKKNLSNYHLIMIDVFENEKIDQEVKKLNFVSKIESVLANHCILFVNFGHTQGNDFSEIIETYKNKFPGIELYLSHKNLIGVFSRGIEKTAWKKGELSAHLLTKL